MWSRPRDDRVLRRERLGQRQRVGGREVLDREHQRSARFVRRQDHVPPGALVRARGIAAGAGNRVGRRQAAGAQLAHAGVGVVGAERHSDQPLAVAVEPRAQHRRAAALAHRPEQLEVGVLEPEQRVRGALTRVRAAPRRRATEQRRVGLGRRLEVAHADDHVVERVQHAPSLPESLRALVIPSCSQVRARRLCHVPSGGTVSMTIGYYTAAHDFVRLENAALLPARAERPTGRRARRDASTPRWRPRA